MKMLILYCYLTPLALFPFTGLHAQDRAAPTPEQNAAKLTQWMRGTLELNNNQADQVQTINLKYAYKLYDLQNRPDTKQQKMRALKADGDAKDQEMKRVLTSEQFQKWLIKKEEAKRLVNENIKRKKGG